MTSQAAPEFPSGPSDAAGPHPGGAHAGVSPGEIAIGVIIGRASEAFDFFVFVIACVIVFPAIIFPFAGPLVGTLYAFAVFSLAFIARPIASTSWGVRNLKAGEVQSDALTLAQTSPLAP